MGLCKRTKLFMLGKVRWLRGWQEHKVFSLEKRTPGSSDYQHGGKPFKKWHYILWPCCMKEI